ncbi:hypothetical protein KC367_g1667 [Hortaea werneckii]|nr:hypothetical protein KC367_g1667 [Hortaea werneckii]
MDELPPELTELIIEQCDFSSLKHMRLVTKRFEHLATPLVFRDFYAAFFAYSLGNIGKVADNRVAKHVRNLTIYADFLPNWEQDEWRRERDRRPSFLSWKARRKKLIVAGCLRTHQAANKLYDCLDGDIEGGLCEECLGRIGNVRVEYDKEFAYWPGSEQAWTRFCQLKDEQWNSLTEDVHGIMLKEHLSRLPNLESVAVKPALAPGEEIKNLPVWKSLQREILVSPKNWMHISGGPELHDILDGQSVHNPEFLSSPLQWTLEAVGHRAQYSGTGQVKRLLLLHNDLTPLKEVIRAAVKASSTSDNPLAQGVRFQTVVEALSHVSDLTFEFPYAGEAEEAYGRQFRDEAVELLNAAKNLKILKLQYQEEELDESSMSMRFDLSGHFADLESNPDAFRWPHLTLLSLSTNVKAEPFLAFLVAHSTTLRSLTLVEMDLGDVQKVLSAIPHVLPALTDVRVECVIDLIQGTPGQEDEDDVWAHYLIKGTSHQDKYEQDVKRYLLGQREELPLLLDENWMNDFSSGNSEDESEDESEEQTSENSNLNEDEDDDDQS